jgi:hypothetical protein
VTSDNESSSAIGSSVRDNAKKRQPEPMTTDATFTPSIQTVLSQKPQTPNIVYSTYRSAMPHIVTIKKAKNRGTRDREVGACEERWVLWKEVCDF